MARSLTKIGVLAASVASIVVVLVVSRGGPRIELLDGPYGGARTIGLVGPVTYTIETETGGKVAGFAVDAGTGRLMPEPGGRQIVEMDIVESSGCGLDTGGLVWCWTEERPDPSPVLLPSAAVGVTAGVKKGCAILADRAFHCWGWDDYRASLAAVDVTASAADRGAVCVVTAVGEVSCLMGGAWSRVSLPKPVRGIVAHGEEFCAYGADVNCWEGDLRPGPSENPASVNVEWMYMGKKRVCVSTLDAAYCRGRNGSRIYVQDKDVSGNVEVHGGELECRRETMLLGYSAGSITHSCVGSAPGWFKDGGNWVYAEKSGVVTCAIDVGRLVVCGGDEPRTLPFRVLDGLRLRATDGYGGTVTLVLGEGR